MCKETGKDVLREMNVFLSEVRLAAGRFVIRRYTRRSVVATGPT
jgi:hypothetical protein